MTKNNPFQFFLSLIDSRYYWLVLAFLSVAQLVVALFYQYVLNEWPCVMCIQVRLWTSLILLVGISGYFGHQNRYVNILSHTGVTVSAAGLCERSYMLLGTERGFVFSDCGFDPGLPAWFDVGGWVPWLFRIEASCGYTPEILFGITMAEALMAFSVILLFVAVIALFRSIFQKR